MNNRYELATNGNALPYPALSNVAVIEAVRAGRRLDEVRGTPPALASLMYTCTTLDRRERPTFAALVNILEQLLQTAIEEEQNALKRLEALGLKPLRRAAASVSKSRSGTGLSGTASPGPTSRSRSIARDTSSMAPSAASEKGLANDGVTAIASRGFRSADSTPTTPRSIAAKAADHQRSGSAADNPALDRPLLTVSGLSAAELAAEMIGLDFTSARKYQWQNRAPAADHLEHNVNTDAYFEERARFGGNVLLSEETAYRTLQQEVAMADASQSSTGTTGQSSSSSSDSWGLQMHRMEVGCEDDDGGDITAVSPFKNTLDSTV